MEYLTLGLSVVCSFLASVCLYKIEKRDKRLTEAAAKKEQDREEFEVCMIRSTNAAMSLAEATARAVQRIPDAKCNGDMKKALDFAEKVKHEQKDYLNRKAVEKIV